MLNPQRSIAVAYRMGEHQRLSSVDSSKPLVYIRFRPAWTYIDGIREFGRFFCEETFQESDVAERACMVLQETLENAVKYSRPSNDNELELSISSDGANLTISVVSAPAKEHLYTLRDELRLLYSRPAEEAYLAAFERASDDPQASARLGLARVRYEGGVDLTVEEEGTDRIRVTASGIISGERKST